MPRREDLPNSLAGLARRNALLIRHESFRYDAGRLVTAIERVLAVVPDTAAVPSAFDAHDVRSAENAIGEAATASARTARLLADAERAAQSITMSHQKEWALRDLAVRAAAADPDRAERIAQSFTHTSTA